MRIVNLPVLAVAVLSLGCSRSVVGKKTVQEIAPEPNVLAVEGLTLTMGRLVEEVRSAGLVEGLREAWVVSETQGVVQSVNFSLGDRVSVGQVLMTVDDNLLRSSLRLNEQRLETARLEANAAKTNYDNGSLSQVQYSKTRDLLLAAQSAYDKARDDFDNTRLTAPISGAIASEEQVVGVGNYLSRGTRVARIVDNSSFKTEITVGQGEVVKIREGDNAKVRGSDGTVRSGRVTAMSAGFIVQVQWVPKPGDLLLSGMSVDVSVAVKRGEPVIIIPASAVIYRSDKSYVYVDSAGKTERREVNVGLRLGERMEVVNGLSEGEIIITTGLSSLSPGMAVKTTVTGESGNIL